MRSLFVYLTAALVLPLAGCAGTRSDLSAPVIPVDTRSAQPGDSITRSGNPVHLTGDPVKVGDPLPDVTLIDSTLVQRRFTDYRGKVLLISIVPSLDTGVCARQTLELKTLLPSLSPGIQVITISRDLPFAQARFAEENGVTGSLFLSDFADARFGKKTGLLVREISLLARGMMVVDREGIIRYLQVVPEIAHLPDIKRAITEANRIAGS